MGITLPTTTLERAEHLLRQTGDVYASHALSCVGNKRQEFYDAEARRCWDAAEDIRVYLAYRSRQDVV